MRRVVRFVVVVIALLAGFFANDIVHYFQNPAPARALKSYCHLSSQACEQDGVSMTLAKDTAHPLVATPLDVQWPDSKADTLLLTLEGLEMDMGQAKFVLKRSANGHYATDLMLPVCTTDSMTWVGTLTDGNKTVYPAIRMQR
ncbi:hypothetical protein ACQ676_001294 [Vibrio fluvialis]